MVQRPQPAPALGPGPGRAVRHRPGGGGVHQRAPGGPRLPALLHPQHGLFFRNRGEGPGAARRLSPRGRPCGVVHAPRRKGLFGPAHDLRPPRRRPRGLVSSDRNRSAAGSVVSEMAHPRGPGQGRRTLAGPDAGAVHRYSDRAAGPGAADGFRHPDQARAHAPRGRIPRGGHPGAAGPGAGGRRTGGSDRHRHVPGADGPLRVVGPHRPHVQAQGHPGRDRGPGPEAAAGARAAVAFGCAGQRHGHDPGLSAQPVGAELRLALRGDVSGLQPGGAECGLAAAGAGHPALRGGFPRDAFPSFSGRGRDPRHRRLAARDSARLRFW